jgi:hypothetical protein
MGRKSLKSLAALFRGPFLRQVARGEHLGRLRELLDYSADDRIPSSESSLADFFEYFYMRLLEDYRCEYVYKNAIAIATLADRKEHTVFSGELAVAGSRVDLAIINGTSTAFEIKTELDSPGRLDGQLDDYRKAFDLVFVIVPPNLAKRYELFTPSDVGLVTLAPDGTMTKLRESESHKCYIKPAVAFDVMRQAEYMAAVKERFGRVPSVPNSLAYRECKKLFCQLLPFEAHDAMIRQLRTRSVTNGKAALLSRVPNSLKLAALTLSATQAECKALVTALAQPLRIYENMPSIPPRQTERVIRSSRSGQENRRQQLSPCADNRAC